MDATDERADPRDSYRLRGRADARFRVVGASLSRVLATRAALADIRIDDPDRDCTRSLPDAEADDRAAGDSDALSHDDPRPTADIRHDQRFNQHTDSNVSAGCGADLATDTRESGE